MVTADRYDVVILGGGLAGLCLSIQLKSARPETSILVLEKQTFPVAEAAHKVGESTGEGSSHYFQYYVGMKEHLDTQQLVKTGLRVFFTAGDNRDITKRVEVGPRIGPRVIAYQLDRGRFENALAERAQSLGVTIWDGSKVQDVAISDPHAVILERGGESVSVQCRWVVDASGRAAILKRKLGLAKPSPHLPSAAWFRIDDVIDIDDWADTPTWRDRNPNRDRRLTTTHLVDKGYWVWLIPLASGSHSVGIVAHPEFHNFEEFNTFERAMNWLHRHEPQLADVIEQKRHLLQDFRVLKKFSYSCEKVYSTDRWALVGEAGCFNDPLYSPGSDYIAYANTWVTDMVRRELDGEDVQDRIEFYDEAFRTGFETPIPTWQSVYELFGNPQVGTVKHVWDPLTYWGFVALMFFRDKYTDPEFFVDILPIFIKAFELNTKVNQFFLEWARVDTREWPPLFYDHLATNDHSRAWQSALLEEETDEQIKQRLTDNLATLEAFAAECFRKAAELVGGVPDDRPVNPYAISMDPSRWEADGVFSDQDGEGVLVPKDAEMAEVLSRIWFDKMVEDEKMAAAPAE